MKKFIMFLMVLMMCFGFVMAQVSPEKPYSYTITGDEKTGKGLVTCLCKGKTFDEVWNAVVRTIMENGRTPTIIQKDAGYLLEQWEVEHNAGLHSLVRLLSNPIERTANATERMGFQKYERKWMIEKKGDDVQILCVFEPDIGRKFYVGSKSEYTSLGLSPKPTKKWASKIKEYDDLFDKIVNTIYNTK